MPTPLSVWAFTGKLAASRMTNTSVLARFCEGGITTNCGRVARNVARHTIQNRRKTVKNSKRTAGVSVRLMKFETRADLVSHIQGTAGVRLIKFETRADLIGHLRSQGVK
jgi:hypothetical protein